MRNYKILCKLMKAMIFHDVFLVQLLTFVPFHSIVMYFWHFVISNRDEWNFSVCYWTISPLGNIGKYFAIVKQKVIFPILQILTTNCTKNLPMTNPSLISHKVSDTKFYMIDTCSMPSQSGPVTLQAGLAGKEGRQHCSRFPVEFQLQP
jgi:hypothetical protein